MDDKDKLDSYKIEIRSILLPYQNGCNLAEFSHAYNEMIGKRLPFREMGFRTDVEFLYSMPDVVKITPWGHNNYHLMGVADEKSKHIQKMVLRQKPSRVKTRRPFSGTIGPRFNLGPRFNESRTRDPGSRSQTYLNQYEYQPVKVPKEMPKLPKETPKLPKETPKLPSTERRGPMEEVITLVEHLRTKLALDDLMCEYKRRYNRSLSLSTYGFSTIEDCIKEIPELEIIQTNNVKFVRLCSEKEAASNKSDNKDQNSLKVPLLETPSSYNFENIPKENCDNANIPATLREKLLKVAVRCTSGILSSDFPHCFEEVTGHALEVFNLGYRCLNDFIDDVPDIFVRQPIAGSKKDCLIYPTKYFKPGQKETVEYESQIQRIILNLRRILEAYPEGIKLQDLTHVYSINCRESFHVQDFGFEDLENFLLNIKNCVPLRLDSNDGVKSIHLVKLTETSDNSAYVAPEVYDREAIPYDAVFPEFKYKPHAFPADFNFELFIPAYTSSVVHAGHLYLQFTEDTSSEELSKLNTKLDDFYFGSQSDQYIMKAIHIKVGSSCVAKWPSDNHWYRAQILSIPSMQNVKVIYVDYGTTDTIPKFLLRYAKSEFIDLPAQAVRCRLAYVKPPNNAPKWDIQSRNSILKHCQDVPLMARIEEIGSDGVYSVMLCDTNGNEDVHINFLLINEGVAEKIEKSDCEAPEPKVCTEPPPSLHPLHPLQALQAQYFLQAFAAVAPVFAQNKLYLGLLKEVATLCQNSDHNKGMQFMPTVVPPGFNAVPTGVNKFVNSSGIYGAWPSTASAIGTNSIGNSGANTLFSTKDFYSTSAALLPPTSVALPSPTSLPSLPKISPEENKDIENEVFVDDNDEIFQQFIQKASLTNVRRVKRVKLGDGYKIHIIVIDSEPYASSGEISKLIWNNKNEDFLLTRLQVKDIDIPVLHLTEDHYEQLFQQLLKFKVKGIHETKDFKSAIDLHPLKYVMRILNTFGHPSVILRTKLTEEIAKFNPDDKYWKENIEFLDTVESENEDCLSGATDDDKIEKLCLYDLFVMRDIFTCKKKTMSSSDMTKNTDESNKVERLLQKVLNRIEEIQEICKVFS